MKTTMTPTATDTMQRSVAPEPLPPPVFYPARRVHGLVEAPNTSDAIDHDSLPGQFPLAMSVPEDQDTMASPTLQRAAIESGDILIVQMPEGERAYWVQRKMCKTTRGCVRLGFRLTKRDDTSMIWTLQQSTNTYPFDMVAIKSQDKQACEHPSRSCRDPNVEFSAVQMIARHDPEGLGHVVIGEVCADNDQIYIIMPYFGEGSLAEYIAESGRLSESVARHFFRQIISVCIAVIAKTREKCAVQQVYLSFI